MKECWGLMYDVTGVGSICWLIRQNVFFPLGSMVLLLPGSAFISRAWLVPCSLLCSPFLL